MKLFSAILLVVLLCLPVHVVRATENEELAIHFINVGQADSILIQTPMGKNLLVDAGSKKSAPDLVNYLQRKGVEKLDMVIATHPHHDHIGGMAAVLKHFQIKAFYMPDLSHHTSAFRSLFNTLKDEGIIVFKAKAGDKIEVESHLRIKIIAPLTGRYDYLNDYSYVMKMFYKDRTFLFMGDAGEQSEAELLEKKVNVVADVIKIGHHGANTGTTLPFLKAVDPDVAIITSKKGNRRIPSRFVINRLRYLKIPTYRTDIHGTIIARTDGHNITFSFGSAGKIRSQSTNVE